MPLTFIQQDLTVMHVDAIVNAANAELKRSGGQDHPQTPHNFPKPQSID
ncbi:MAG: hypothetical protein J6M47_04865 [Clostridia bacterium]|nr:hypothetical protein [Clostridia bacterium]